MHLGCVFYLIPLKLQSILLAAYLQVLKPLFGFISDTFPIMGKRRRPYLILCGSTGQHYPHEW